jgi:outer membrane protein assembly factor BamA
MFVNQGMIKWIVLLLLPLGQAFAQGEWHLVWDWPQGHPLAPPKNTVLKDSAQIKPYLEQQYQYHLSKGWATFSIDSLSTRQDTFFVKAYPGHQFKIKSLRVANPPPYFSQEKWSKKNKILTPNLLESTLQPLLSFYSNSGYPFATAHFTLDTMDKVTREIQLGLSIDKGPLIYFDKIVLNEEAPISTSFVKSYLGIKKKGIFRAEIIENAYKNLDELPYLSVSPKSNLYFEDNQAVLDLFMDPRNASNFDVLLGLLPQTDPSTGLQTFTLTGNMNIELFNPFQRGEYLSLRYRSPGNTSQELKIKASYPYLLQMPFGLESQFDLFRRDSSFADLKFNVSLGYLFRGVNHFSVFYESDQSSLLSLPINNIINSGRLPDNLDFTFAQYGLKLHLEKLDYRFNPREGWRIQMGLGLGKRKIIRNPLLLEIPAETLDVIALYEARQEEILKSNLLSEISYFQGLGPFTTLLLRNRAGWQWTNDRNQLFQNELFRLGGIYTLRGFDEDVYFTDRYLINTAELRLLTGKNSNLFVFADYALLSILQQAQALQAYGLGGGLNAETKIGIFSLTYALGNTTDLGPDIRNGKIHIGYLAVF